MTAESSTAASSVQHSRWARSFLRMRCKRFWQAQRERPISSAAGLLALLFQGHQAEQLCLLGRKALGSLLPEQGGVLALLPLPQPIRSRKLFFQGEHPGPAAVLLPAQV